MSGLIGELSSEGSLVGSLSKEGSLSGGLSLATVGMLLWFGTRAEYNALEFISPNVCYCIEEGT